MAPLAALHAWSWPSRSSGFIRHWALRGEGLGLRAEDVGLGGLRGSPGCT